MLVGPGFERGYVDAGVGKQRLVAERDLAPFDGAGDALAGVRGKPGDRRHVDALLRCSLDDRRRERVFAAFFKRGGQPQDVLFGNSGYGPDRDQPRPAQGQGPCLVDDQRVDFFHQLQGLGVLDEHADRRAAARSDHDRHRRCQPKRAGTGDDEDGNGVDERMAQPRLGTDQRPDDEGDDCNQDDAGDKPSGNLVREPLDWCARSLCLGNHANDLGKHGVAAHASARMTRAPCR